MNAPGCAGFNHKPPLAAAETLPSLNAQTNHMKKPRPKRKPITKAALQRKLADAIGHNRSLAKDYATISLRCVEFQKEMQAVRQRSAEILACHDAEKARAEREERAHRIAHATLAGAGWTLAPGASAWTPPIGKTSGPLLDRIDELREGNRLAKERAAAAEQNASRVKTEAAERRNAMEALLAEKSATIASMTESLRNRNRHLEFYHARTIEYYEDRQTLRARLRSCLLDKPPTHHDRIFLDSLKD